MNLVRPQEGGPTAIGEERGQFYISEKVVRRTGSYAYAWKYVSGIIPGNLRYTLYNRYT